MKLSKLMTTKNLIFPLIFDMKAKIAVYIQKCGLYTWGYICGIVHNLAGFIFFFGMGVLVGLPAAASLPKRKRL